MSLLINNKEGIYKDIDIEEYHKDKGISSSGISLILESPKKYYYQYVSGLAEIEDKKSLKVGSALHLLALEPQNFDKHFSVLPKGLDRRTTKGKEEYKALELLGKALISHSDFEEASSMAYSIRSNKAFAEILKRKGNIEDSIYWTHNSGVQLRARPDWYDDDFIVDIKTTKCASKEEFAKSIANYGYHRQAYMCLTGLSKATRRTYKNVLLIAVENTAPYLTASYLLSEETIEAGRIEVEKGIELYHECLQTKEWPGYQEFIESISLPKWYSKQIQEKPYVNF